VGPAVHGVALRRDSANRLALALWGRIPWALEIGDHARKMIAIDTKVRRVLLPGGMWLGERRKLA